MKPLLILPIVAVVLLGCVAHGEDLQQGVAAAKKGDWKTALKKWRPLAEQGIVAAQVALGLSYYGKGFPRDWRQALKWLQLAAAHKDATAQFLLGVLRRGRQV